MMDCTDWELGRPPANVEVSVFVHGNVRHGFSDGAWFRYTDCTHPMQNSIASLLNVEAWKLNSTCKP